MDSSATAIAIVVDQKCNIQCDHCCFSSSPRSQGHLRDEDILSIVDQAIANVNIRTVGFSGGEAMLRKRVIIQALERLHANNMTASITTNCFWGRKPAIADRLVNELKCKGLSILTISYDYFHAQFIPVSCISNVLEACRRHHLQARINIAVTHSHDAAHVVQQLGDSVLGVPISIFPIQPVGRGASVPDDDIIRVENEPANMRCPGFEPTFHFDGRIYPCCSIRNSSVEESIAYITHNAFFALIRQEGFGWIYKKGQELGFFPTRNQSFVDVCELCHMVTTNVQFMTALIPQIQQRFSDFGQFRKTQCHHDDA